MKRHVILFLFLVTLLVQPTYASITPPTLAPHSPPPSSEEILSKAEILVTHQLPDKEKTTVMRESIAAAVQAWLQQEYPEAVRLFRVHVAAYPDSPWRAEALLHLGFDALNNMRFTEAEEDFSTVISESRTRDTLGAKLILNRAKLGLGNVKVNQHNLREARSIFNDLQLNGSDWRERTYAGHWLHRLSGYVANELSMLNCGSRALAWLMEHDGDTESAVEVRQILPKTRAGHSLKDLYDIAARYGYHLDAAKLTAAEISKLSLPVIMHVKNNNPDEIGHFWILEKVEGDKLTFFVPKEGLQFRQNLDEFVKEWSGHAVTISEEALPGVALTQNEMAGIFGANGGGGGPRLEDSLGACDDDSCKQASTAGSNQAPTGAPTWFVNMVNFNLYLTDTPLWYTPPIGPEMAIQLNYNSQSATSTREPFGNKWQFNYNSYLEIQTSGTVVVYMPDGRRDVYNPDQSGGYTRPYRVYNTLTKNSGTNYTLTFPDGRIHVYDKPQPSLTNPVLTELRDAYGQKLSFTYNAAGQLTAVTDATGKTTTLSYYGTGLVSLVTDPFGRTAAFQYDVAKNLTKITDMGGYWSAFAYDATVYLTSINNGVDSWGFHIEPSGGITVDQYPPPGGVMGDNYRITVTNPAGGKEEFYYAQALGDGLHVTPRYYVAYQNSTTNNYASAAVEKVYYSYSHIGARGEIGTITQPTGDALNFGYDANGLRTSKTDSWGTTSNTRNAMGLPATITDGLGTLTTLTYQPNNVDLATIVNGLGATTLAYNASHDVTSMIDRMGRTSSRTYNTLGQLTSETDPIGTVTAYSYDAGHFLTEITRGGYILKMFTYDEFGRMKTITDEDGLTVTIDYNNLNDIIKVTYPDGKYMSWGYSATIPHQVISATDRSGRTVSYIYNLLRRLTRVNFPDGGFITYERDANGNMTGFTDTMGNRTAYAYDAAGQLSTKTYADGQTAAYGYTNGLLTGDEENSFSYDGNHNIIGNGYASFGYDPYNRRTTMTMMEAGDSGLIYNTSTFTYDANSRLSSVDGPWDNDTITFQRDAKGRITGLSVQGGQTVSYSYDTLDRLIGIQRDSDTYSYTYTGTSRLPDKLTRPNGSYTEYQYDNMKRLLSLANKNSGGAVISRYDYTYNSQDKRATETVTNGPAVPVLQAGTTNYTHNNLNQMLTSSDADFSYLNGFLQMESKQGEEYNSVYSFSYMNKVLDFMFGANGIDTYFSYDADRFMIRKRTEGAQTGETRYVRLGDLVLQERDVNNNVTREYLWQPGQPGGIGGLLDLKQGGQKYSYLYDGKGNVTALIDSTQAVAVTYAYDPFGTPTTVTGTLNQPYRFSTKPYDDNTGLFYYGYRFYKPDIGRWISRDPIRERGGLNLYGFVGNDPVNNVDPLGLECKDDSCLFKGIWLLEDLFCGSSDKDKPKTDLPSDYTPVNPHTPKKDNPFKPPPTEKGDWG
jgi:RHS repeat-associated protein